MVLITLIVYPSSTYIFGFLAASVVFDVATRLVGYRLIIRVKSKIGAAGLIASSLFSSMVSRDSDWCPIHAAGSYHSLRRTRHICRATCFRWISWRYYRSLLLRGLKSRNIITETPCQDTLGKT